jgi:hypothetical protein
VELGFGLPPLGPGWGWASSCWRARSRSARRGCQLRPWRLKRRLMCTSMFFSTAPEPALTKGGVRPRLRRRAAGICRQASMPWRWLEGLERTGSQVAQGGFWRGLPRRHGRRLDVADTETRDAPCGNEAQPLGAVWLGLNLFHPQLTINQHQPPKAATGVGRIRTHGQVFVPVRLSACRGFVPRYIRA